MNARWLALGALVAVVALPVRALDLGNIINILPDVAQTTGISEPDEIAVGREIAGRVLGAAALTRDANAQGYVNRVGRWIALQSERPDLPWRFGVIDSPNINAFAAPGGYVLLTRGLYDILENEAQLAGVLAHEIGHIVKRHHITVMQKSAAVSAGSKLLQSRAGSGELVRALAGNGAEIFARSLDKGAEFEADQLGVVLAARAGYSPYGLVEVLQKLGARSSADSTLALLYKTHPHPDERLSKLGEALEPRVADLPQGAEPDITRISVQAGTAPRAPQTPAPQTPAQAPAQTPNQAVAPSSAPAPNPVNILKGLFGR
jgi:predicted Zn-dependent protease